MKRSIWKFPFMVSDTVVIEMPVASTVIHVGVQHGRLCLWALVWTKNKVESRTFLVRGTGHPCDELNASDHIGTVQDGPFVWHVFDR